MPEKPFFYVMYVKNESWSPYVKNAEKYKKSLESIIENSKNQLPKSHKIKKKNNNVLANARNEHILYKKHKNVRKKKNPF